MAKEKEVKLEGTGVHNGHSFVDLGLPSGLKWATCNVGASNQEDSGDYFAWGEISAKENYDWDTYQYGDFSDTTKYTRSDKLNILEATDDAATANWGAGWRLPTEKELNELYNNCTHGWTTQNGVNGEKFTGPNGNSIFLPAAGYRFGSSLDCVGTHGCYWLSSLYADDLNSAWELFFVSVICYTTDYRRCYGLSVRAVCQPQK